jgi:ribosomal protein S27E
VGLSASYTVDCDLCGTDTGSSQRSVDDAWDYAQRGGWWIHRGYYVAVCEDCYDPEKIYHAQRKNVFCVLCQTGEHIAVIK